MRKKFKLNLRKGLIPSSYTFIGLAKAMSKTDARIVSWEQGSESYIIFSVKENYPIFKEQLKSYGIIVEELLTSKQKRGSE